MIITTECFLYKFFFQNAEVIDGNLHLCLYSHVCVIITFQSCNRISCSVLVNILSLE